MRVQVIQVNDINGPPSRDAAVIVDVVANVLNSVPLDAFPCRYCLGTPCDVVTADRIADRLADSYR